MKYTVLTKTNKKQIIMSKTLRTSLLLLAMIFAGSLKAQTTITSYLMDSTMNYCPLPAAAGVSGWGNTTGYNDVTDNMTVQIFWGDGSDTTFLADLLDGGGTNDYYSVWAMHNYSVAGTYTPMMISTGPDANDDTTYCTPMTFSAGCILLDGYTYRDNNANCVFDAGDDTLKWVALDVTDLTGSTIYEYGYSDYNGHYVISMPSGTGSYKIQPELTWSYTYNTVICPVAGSYTFTPSTGYTFDFALDCATPLYDLSLWGNSWTDVPGGTTGFGYVYAYNASCNPVTGTITVTLDPNVTFTGMTYGPAPTSVVGSTLTWTHLFGAWPSFPSHIYLEWSQSTSTGVTVLDTICGYNAIITPTSGDLDPTNNSVTWCDVVGGPYDPNSKEVYPAGTGATGKVAPNTDFDYIIHFQNCGTAEAVNIYVLDTIDTDLDIATLQITGSSHTMTPTVNGNTVRFDFPSIHLIDSTTNEPLSHGWLSYHINSKSGLANGTTINNTGYIYFDYNAAVVTNTTLNTIDISMGVNEQLVTTNNNALFPNPATNKFTVQFEKEVSGTLFMIDASGKTVKQLNVNGSKEIVVSTNELESGFYALSMPGVVLKQNRVQVIK
jgi:hypothetical protein